MPEVFRPVATKRRIPAEDWRRASMLFVGVLAVYVATMMGFGHFRSSPDSYFDRLAAAFLHGRTDLVNPAAVVDLARYAGRWYVPFPPLPAVLMLPPIAIVGIERFNVAAFVAIAGSIAAAGAFLSLQQLAANGVTTLNASENVWLTVAFGFGSVSWYMATTSSVWFVAQVSAYCCAMLAVLCVSAGVSPLWAGAALGLAAAGRPHTVAVLPLLVALQYVRGGRVSLQWIVKLLAPIVVSAAALAAYNVVRFGAAGDFGYRYALADDQLGRDFLRYGQFSLHFLPHNLYAWLLELPHWNPARHFWVPNRDGMSIFLAMPFIVWIIKARRADSPLVWPAFASLAIGLVPPLLYYNSGAWQFGPRFFMDVMPAAVVLMALAMKNGLTPAFRAAVVVSIMINAAGTVWWQWPR